MKINFSRHLTKSPMKLQVWTYCLFWIVLLASYLLIQGRYGKQEIVKGVIRSESFYRITTDKPGNISFVHVKEGDKVQKGDVLFRIAAFAPGIKDTENGQLTSDNTLSHLKSLLNKYSLEEQALQEERLLFTSEKSKYNTQVAIDLGEIGNIEDDYKQKINGFRKQLKDYEALFKENAIGKSDVENIKQTIKDTEIAHKKLILERNNILRSIAEKKISFSRSDNEMLQRKHDIERRKIEVNNEINNIMMTREYEVISPVNGVVHYSDILNGDFVDGKYPAMILKGDVNNKPQVVLYLSAQQIGLLNKEQNIFLRVDTFPYEVYGMLSAKIINISQTPTKISINDKDSWFRVRLSIQEEAPYNRIPVAYLNDGMTVTTSLRQPEQNLLEWLFLPVKKAFKRNPDFIHDI
ncbi:HlyD family efflux transporter periplasmic adaptor subunit [Enterobacter ludwigii]|uniref:HlyD family secretion protein n=1 Tax=Enterobacter ludwigii TaxID=299767 RepID=UPI003D1D9D8F